MSEESTELLDLDYTKSVRKKLINAICKNETMPEETKTQMVLLSALDGIDRAALAQLKIKSDNAISEQQNTAMLIASIFNTTDLKDFGKTQIGEEVRTIPTLDEDITISNLAEGELDLVASNETYDTFMQRMNLEI